MKNEHLVWAYSEQDLPERARQLASALNGHLPAMQDSITVGLIVDAFVDVREGAAQEPPPQSGLQHRIDDWPEVIMKALIYCYADGKPKFLGDISDADRVAIVAKLATPAPQDMR